MNLMYIKYTKILVLILSMLGIIGGPINASSEKKHTISNIYLFNKFFTGREKILIEIERKYKNQESPIVLTGSPGIGKSQIAKKYVENNIKNFPIVWWVDAAKNIDEQLFNLGHSWNQQFGNKYGKIDFESKSADQITIQLLVILADTPINWLLVFDNASNYSSIQKYLVKNKACKKSFIIVTSKNGLGWENAIKVNEFTPQESQQFLKSTLPRSSKFEVESLQNLVHNHPLALAKAAGFIIQNPLITPQDYASIFKRNRNLLWKKENQKSIKKELSSVEENYISSVYISLYLPIQKIKRNPQAYNLLGFISLLGSQNIPLSLLREYFLNQNPSSNADEFYDALNTILEASLISLEREENKDKIFSIHELIQLVYLDQLCSLERKILLQNVMEFMKQPLMKNKELLVSAVYNKKPYFLNHSEYLIKNAEKYEIANEAYYKLKVHIIEHYISGKRDYHTAEKLLTSLSKKTSKIPIKDRLVQARLFLNRANYLWWKGKGTEAIQVVIKSINILDNYPDQLEEKLRAQYYLGIAYASKGEYSTALFYLRNAEKLSEGKEVSSYLKYNIFYPQAMAYLDQGKLKEALAAAHIAVQEAENSKTAYRSYIHVRLLKALILIFMNTEKEAAKEIEKIYVHDKELLKSGQHELLGRLKLLEAYIFLKQELFDQARESLKVSKMIFDKWYKGSRNHRHQALLYKLEGDLEKHLSKKLERYKQAEETYKKSLSNHKIFELRLLYKDLIQIYLKCNDLLMSKEYFKKLIKIQGEFHPDSIKISRDLY